MDKLERFLNRRKSVDSDRISLQQYSEEITQGILISFFENFKDFISKFNIAKLHLLKFIKCKLE